MSDKCYYDSEECSGELWQCETCGEWFCSETHSHSTDIGANVECVACERVRLENNNDGETYGKWDSAEGVETAFSNVKYEKWDLSRFEEWVRHLVVTEVREATGEE